MGSKILNANGDALPTSEDGGKTPEQLLFEKVFLNQDVFAKGLRKCMPVAMDIALGFGGMAEEEAERAINDGHDKVQELLVDPLMGLFAEALETAFYELIKHGEFADRAQAFDKKFKIVSALPDENGNGIPVFAVGRNARKH